MPTRRFPTSPEINAKIGAAVRERTGASVNLDDPEFTIHIEILPGEAFFHVERLPGAGGLPSWDLGEGRGPPFRRDRLPRRDVPDDAARL